MSEHVTARTRALGGSLGILPSHLRLALLKYADDEAFNLDPTGKTRIIPRSVMLDCDVVTTAEPAENVIPNIDPVRGYESAPNGEDAHPHDDATGHVGRTHEDFGPRLEKKHITDKPSWGGVGC